MKRAASYLVLFVVFAFLLLAFSISFGVPVPPGHSAAYIAGWQERDTYVPPTTQPATPHDITALLNAATAAVDLPKGDYAISAQVKLTQNVHLNGSTIHCPNGITDFIFMEPELTFDSFTAVGGGVLFEFGADHCTVSNFQISGVAQAFKTIPLGNNASIINGHIGLTATCSAYFDRGGASVLNVDFDGVTNGAEYPLRFDVASGGKDAGHVQSGLTIKDCNIVNHSGTKDTVGIREWYGVNISGGSIAGNIRIGQDPPAGFPQPTKVGQYCDNIVIDHVAFAGTGSPMSAVTVKQASRVTVTNCTFTNYTVPCITAWTLSEVSTGGNGGPAAAKLWAKSSLGRQILLPSK